MSDFYVLQCEDIPVASVKSENGPAGARAAFQRLEAKLESLKGRKMYGAFYPDSGDYYACVGLDEAYPDDMGLEKRVVPGGKYARRKMENWEEKTAEIKSAFLNLQNSAMSGGLELDALRPHIEFYRSGKELFLLVPVK